ncbi:MAG: FG-GAP-like repeat-containing protein [Crocinitomicaceae bacterium]|nr:FG-GAP-like repeat-containing protein [Crocinitomicaceae bacterium]
MNNTLPKSLLILVLLLLCINAKNALAQDPQSALRIEIINPEDVPEVIDAGAYLDILFTNPQVQQVFDNYDVTMFTKEFPLFQGVPGLKNIYYVQYDSTGADLSLDLSTLNYFPLVENVGFGEALAIPTDYVSFTSLDYINVPQAWEITESTPGVKLGQIDLYLRDPSLNTQVDLDESIEIGTGSNFQTVSSGHASGVGRTIAAQANNGICDPFGFCAGVGYDSRLYAGYGSFSLNIQEQITRGVRAVNISMTSGCNFSAIEQLFYDKVAEKGVIIVAAAGNGTVGAANHGLVGGGCFTGSFDNIACNANYTGNSNGYLYPASYDNVISVTGNSNLNDNILWGNTGYDCDIIPGNDTFYDRLLTVNDRVDVISSSSAAVYGAEFGTTSFCAPIVTGAIGLMLSVNPNLDIDECIDIFNLTGVDVSSVGTNSNYFQTVLLEQDRMRNEVRRIDVEAAVIEAKNRYDAWLVLQQAEPTQFDRILVGSHVTDGINSYALNWIDYDNDNDLDIFNSTNQSTPQDPNPEFNMFENLCGALTDFVDVSLPGLDSDNKQFLRIGWGDFNNDGNKDYIGINEDNELIFFENTGNSSFNPSLIVALPSNLPLRNGGVADFNADGNLDFMLGGLLATAPNNVRVFQGNGDGTFTQITGNTTDIYVDLFSVLEVTTGDINGDGHQDIAAIGVLGPEKLNLYLGDGNFGFTKAILDLDPAHLAIGGYGVTMVDYDNDTDLDLYFFGFPNGVLYNNLNNGKFFYVDNVLITTDPTLPNSNVTWGDYDNDGDQDVYIPSLQTKTLYNNERGIIFSAATNEFPSFGSETDHETNDAAFGDADNDGDLDLYVNNFFNNDLNNYFYENLGNANSWIKLKLAGSNQDYGFVGTGGLPRKTSLSAEGTRIVATVTSFSGPPSSVNCTQIRHIQTGDGSPHDVHFGFGDHTGSVSIRIQWPSGLEELFVLAVNNCYQITEGSGTFTTGCACTADLPAGNEIAGTVGFDDNHDCDCDDDNDGIVDYPLDNFFVQIDEDLGGGTIGSTYFAQTQPTGEYSMLVPNGDYIITPYLAGTAYQLSNDCTGNPNNFTPNNYSVTVPPNSYDNDFCLYSTDCDIDVSVYPVYQSPASAPCPDIDQQYCMTISNNGTSTIDPVFTLNLDDNMMINSVNSPCGTVVIDNVANTITLNYVGSFGPGEVCTICADVTIDSGILGSTLLTLAEVGGTCTETDQMQEFVNCAIDPNDKLLVNPQSCGPENNIANDQLLTYRIRYQNEGNAPAVNVVIKDLLDENMDISTFQVLSTSHTIDNVSILPGNKLILEMNDIQLPPLSVDPAGSQGFVIFGIKALSNVPEGTIVDNTASIYFDLNEAVVTNTVFNTLREYPSPDVQFTWSNSCTSLDISYDFEYTGATPDGATYLWDFGPNATPQFSTDANPTDILFSNGNTESVTLTVLRYGCDESLTQDVGVSSPVGCNGNNNKVEICHNGNTLCININALQAHLDHGDCVGECSSNKSAIQGGKDETNDAKDISVFPNPSEGKFNVELNDVNVIEYQVIGMLGSIVLEGKPNGNKFLLDLTNKNSGVYMLIVITDEGLLTQRIEKM